MTELTVVGLDLAKAVFQAHEMSTEGRKLRSLKLKRGQVLAYFAQLPPILVGMEACGSAHYWAREISALGHQVKMMAPQHVKAFVQGNKTDARDAAAIAEAACRVSVPSVAVRSLAGQQMQALHRVRDGWMKHRVALGNQIRGLLAEFGESIAQGFKSLKEGVAKWQAQAGEELSVLKELIEQLITALRQTEERLHILEVKIKVLHRDNAASRLIESIPGVGMLSATAIVASFGQCESFTSARKFASCLGLTPREHSSGGKQNLLGISKRGNGYLRRLLIQGAHAVLKVSFEHPAHQDDWVVTLAKRRGKNIAAVALASKNARRIWAMLRSGEMFQAAYTPEQNVQA